MFVSLRILVLSVAVAGNVACHSSESSPAGDGGAVTGAADMHCSGVTPIVASPASCHPPDAGVPADADVPSGDGGEPPEEMAEILFNAQGDDDDCKYRVKFETTAPAARNRNLTFKLTLAGKTDGKPATGGIDGSGEGVYIEAYLADNLFHVAPNTTPATTATETPAGSGVYTITPVRFDAPGRWVVRFHFFETCSDFPEDSPHGHVAFYFDVP